MNSKQFGGKITGVLKEQYSQSQNWKDGKFRNLVATVTGVDWRKLPGMLCRQIKGHKLSEPKQALPVKPFDEAEFLKQSDSSKFVWYGHSVVLMRLNNQTILIDPMLGGDASPIGPKRTKRFSKNTINIIDDLPEIDLVLLTHDHYDHLDYASILKLKTKVKNFWVGLGLKRHLISWGIDENIIKEFDWWDNHSFNEIQITYTPTRHFSGRGLTSMAKCLWGGWALQSEQESIWFSGDGGFGDHFKDIGKQLGPFDLAFMECGQYNVDWHDIHMFPKESVQAAIEAGAKVAVPVHWGGFNLSYQHAWFEPVEEFIKYANADKLNFKTPAIGEIFSIKTITKKWWEDFK